MDVRSDLAGGCMPCAYGGADGPISQPGPKAAEGGKKGSWRLSWLLLTVPKDQPGIDSMSLPQANDQPRECPPSLDDLRFQLHQRLDQVIDACQNDHGQASFLDFEKALLPHLS